jgi:hypothetical protein
MAVMAVNAATLRNDFDQIFITGLLIGHHPKIVAMLPEKA